MKSSFQAHFCTSNVTSYGIYRDHESIGIPNHQITPIMEQKENMDSFNYHAISHTNKIPLSTIPGCKFIYEALIQLTQQANQPRKTSFEAQSIATEGEPKIRGEFVQGNLNSGEICTFI